MLMVVKKVIRRNFMMKVEIVLKNKACNKKIALLCVLLIMEVAVLSVTVHFPSSLISWAIDRLCGPEMLFTTVSIFCYFSYFQNTYVASKQ